MSRWVLPLRFAFVGALALVSACSPEETKAPRGLVAPSGGEGADGRRALPDAGAVGNEGGGQGGAAAPVEVEDAGIVAEPEPMVVPDAGPVEPPRPDLPTCDDDAEPFVAVAERASIEATGPHYQGVDSETAPMRAMLIDIFDSEGEIEPGTFFDLAGTNLSDCQVCVTALTGCDPATGRCAKVFYPTSGLVEITAIGEVGESFIATLHGLEFEEVTINPTSNRSTPVAGGETFCNPEMAIDTEVRPQPARLRETVRDFSLQNCETGEFVSMHELGADAKALWFIASAGWCAACAEVLPQAIAAMDQIAMNLGEGALKPVIVVGENANYGQPTVRYCQQYAEHYGTDVSRFYIDHNGASSFATTFQYIWPYLAADGSFGMPWNGLVRGGTFEYFYADRSGESDLNTAINAILR